MKSLRTKHLSATSQRENPSEFTPRILIVDDDPIVAAVVKRHLEPEFPSAEVSTSQSAEIEPGYDVYFIDNDFDGESLALDLLKSVRRLVPHALVVALSNTLDFDVMAELLNAGCNAVYNKRDLPESEAARSVIHAYFEVLAESRKRSETGHILPLIGSMRRLIESWNRRLELTPAGTAQPSQLKA